MQEFMPLDDLHKKNLAYAINQRKNLEEEVAPDTEYLQNWLQQKNHAEYVEYFQKYKQLKISHVDRFIAALPGMLSDVPSTMLRK